MKLAGAAMVVCVLGSSVRADDVEPKSDGTATLISLGAGIGLPLVLGSIGGSVHDRRSQDVFATATIGALVLGPTAGHWYAGRGWTNATTARVIGGAAFVAGLGVALSDCPLFSSSDGCHGGPGGPLAVIGGGVFAVGFIYDLATAGRSAREYNAAHLAVSPVPVSTGGRSTLGLAVAGAF